MPITHYIAGDLFKTDIPVIAHGCNAQGVMGSGVAKIVKERYAVAYTAYVAFCKTQNVLRLMGRNVAVKCNHNRTIVNMITQERYGRDGQRYVSYDAISKCFNSLENMGYEKVAIPKLGAGLGGGDWTVIEAIINSETPNTDIWVYEYE